MASDTQDKGAEQRNQRIGNAVEQMMHRLKQRSPHRAKYLFQNVEVTGRQDQQFFQIAEKIDPGQPLPNGSNWKTYKGPTRRQLEMMEATSLSNEELSERIEQFVMQGIDTTRSVVNQPQATSPFDDQAINRLVAAKVEQILSDRQKTNALLKGKETAEEVVAKTDFEKLPKAPKYGDKRTKKYGDKKRLQESEYQTVKQRCEVLGIPASQIYVNGSGQINKVWLKQLNVKWAQYCARSAPNAGDALAQARASLSQPSAEQPA